MHKPLLVIDDKSPKLRTEDEKNASDYWPAPPDDPQGIRVAFVIEFIFIEL